MIDINFELNEILHLRHAVEQQAEYIERLARNEGDPIQRNHLFRQARYARGLSNKVVAAIKNAIK